ncbi:helix-turn-helix domain-containing protein [Paenibacillus sp. J2TS4]|uniref:helix-turn-helix domain-containing protein n=1 Tax=Paenibacillus sp. J2TS4 TaxID=2807194 RepID=UPI001B294B99|nr:helix-turn-helix domain-containing protein [Paenibacillus sp. J2TS4]GIP34168.1 hypothetical protein J2TS4_33780 [Paenibacillus sp. J2TS4]
MYRILIVDDEWLVREGLKQTIPWHEIECSLIGEASNGQAGWLMANQYEPDILLTDIRMPGIDGLELAKRVGEAHPRTKIVFLTGFDEFAYAQQAIKIGAADFVLKPTDPEELIRTIRNVTRQIDEERARQEYSKRLELRIENSQPILLEKLLYDFMLDNAREYEAGLLRELLGQRLETIFSSFQVAIVEWKREPDEDQGAKQRWTASLEELLAAVEGEARAGLDSTRVPIHENRIAVILANRSPHWLEEADRCVAAAREKGWGVTVGVSGVHQHYDSIAKAYHEAEVALQQKEYIEQNRIIGFAELDELKIREKYGLSPIEKYIREHYDKDISLQDVAATVHMSESYFSRVFKKYSGVSFIEYVTQLRLEKAKQLLQRPDAKIYEVALAVGYQDSRYFSQLFRKWTGETPTEFRRRMGLH